MVSRRSTPDRREDEERIRQRAYEIWEQEGCPQGRDQEHWERAKEEFATKGHYLETLQRDPARRRTHARGGEPVEPLISPAAQAEPIGPNEEKDERAIPAARAGTGASASVSPSAPSRPRRTATAAETKLKEVEPPAERSGKRTAKQAAKGPGAGSASAIKTRVGRPRRVKSTP